MNQGVRSDMGAGDAKLFDSGGREGAGRLERVDFAVIADRLGADFAGEGVILPFYGIDHRVTTAGVSDMSGCPANDAVSHVLLSYVLRCPATLPPDGPWITFREFTGAGPLMKYFVDNTHKLIENTFAVNGDTLETACFRLGATAVETPGYDVSMEIPALPRIPLRFRFNLRDSEFPAQCSLLFRKSAEIYLDMKSMALAGTWFAGNLVGFLGDGKTV